jgi:hypothetical protein
MRNRGVGNFSGDDAHIRKHQVTVQRPCHETDHSPPLVPRLTCHARPIAARVRDVNVANGFGCGIVEVTE